jgi:hypothetical protein
VAFPGRAAQVLAAAHHRAHLVLGGLLVLAHGSVVAPFIYTLF